MPLMNRIRCALIASAALGACSPDSGPQAPVSPVPPPTPPEAPASATELIGMVDDPQALRTFLLMKASRGSPPPSVVAQTVDGGPAHPRITLVYMSAPDWCGSGGCTLFILGPGGAGLAELGAITLVHAPVLVLDTRTNGMPDISVRVRSDSYPGPGEKFVVLPFDGHAYASNPTMPPARLLPRSMADGEIAISEGQVAIALHR